MTYLFIYSFSQIKTFTYKNIYDSGQKAVKTAEKPEVLFITRVQKYLKIKPN